MAEWKMLMLVALACLLFSAEPTASQNSVTIGFSVAGYTVMETDGEVEVMVEVLNSSAVMDDGDVVLTVTTEDDSAVAGEDYNATSEMLTFSALGDTSFRVSIPITNSSTLEAEETFTVTLELFENDTTSNDTVVLSPITTIVTILDTDRVTLSVPETVSVSEEDEDMEVCVNVTLSGAILARDVLVLVETSDGTAVAGEDYTAVNMTYVVTSEVLEVCVPLVDDDSLEESETFFITVSSADSAVMIGNNVTEVTIEIGEDVVIVGFTEEAVTVAEGDNGSLCVEVTDGSLGKQITLNLTGLPPGAPTSVVVEAGDTMGCVLLPVPVDDVFAMDEVFTATLTSDDEGVTITPNVSMVTITDTTVASLGLELETYQVTEGMAVMVCVSFNPPTRLERNTTVTITTEDDTAVAPGDYTAIDEDLVLGPDVASSCVNISTVDNDVFEGDKTITVNLDTMEERVTLNFSSAQVTIIEDDEVVIGFMQTGVEVGEGQTTSLTVTIMNGTLGMDTQLEVTITSMDTGTAMAAMDYEMVNEVLTFTSEEVSIDVEVVTSEDMMGEDTEMFSLILSSNFTTVTLSPDTAIVTIRDAPFISVQPEDQFVLLGDGASFTIVATGYNISIQWLRGAVAIVDSENVMGAQNQTLVIVNVTTSDYGNYTARVSNRLQTTTSMIARLVELTPPRIVDITGDVGVADGDSITLFCSASSPDDMVNVTWSTSVADVTLPTAVETNTSNVFTSSITLDTPVSGEYTCLASNRFNSTSKSLQLFVITINGVEDVEVTVANNATLTCNATGHPNLTYSWGRTVEGVFDVIRFEENGGNPGIDQLGRVRGEDTNVLMFTNVSVTDAMEYGCNVSLFGSFVSTALGNLSTRGPNITMGPVDVMITAGDTLRLNCTATNQPDSPTPLTFDWLRNSIRISPSPMTTSFPMEDNTTTNQVMIPNITSADAGSYYCLVHTRTKDDGVRSDPVDVVVNFVPMVVLYIDSTEYSPVVFLPSGNASMATCVVTAVPEADFKEIGATPPGGTRMTLDSNETMSQMSLTASFTPTLDDNGTVYDCIAGNAIGNGSNSSIVVVQAVPDMINHTQITFDLISLRSVALTWPVPADNNAMITLYTITYCPLDSSGVACIPSTTGTSEVRQSSGSRPMDGMMMDTVRAIITVPPGNVIRVFITASNSIGTGLAPDLGFEFDSATSMDAQPVDPATLVLTPVAAVVSWELPTLARQEEIRVEQFNVTLQPDGGTLVTTVVTPSSSTRGFTFSSAHAGLTAGLSHTVSIVAVYSSPDFLSNATTFTFNTPSQGTAVDPLVELPGRAAPTSAESATITWTLPEEEAEFLTGILVTVTSSPVGTKRRRRQAEQTNTLDPDTTETVITTEPFSNTMVEVDAEFQPVPDGDAVLVPLIDPVTFISLQGSPEAPTDVTAQQVDFSKLDLSWTLPTVTNGIITDHAISATSGGGMATTFRSSSASPTYTLSSLTPNTEYTIIVRSVTNDGRNMGAPSDPITMRTDFGVFPPTVSHFITSTPGVYTLSIGNNQMYGNILFYQVVVIFNDMIDIDSLDTINTIRITDQYYVAWQADYSPQVTFSLGAGNNVTHRGSMFVNSALQGGTNYYVFIRSFSAVDTNVRADSNISPVIRFASPLNTVAIIVPIAAIAVVLLIVLVVLLFFAYLTVRGTFRRSGYTARGGLLEDGKRPHKGSAAIELRRTRLFSPVLNVGTPDVFTSAGQPTTLICEASGTPAPEVTWVHNDLPLDKERFIKLADGSLFINDTDLQDEGTYFVRATNSAGEAEAAVRVTVLRPIPPEPDESDHAPIKVGEFPEKIALVRAEDDEGLEDEYADVELDWTFSSYAAKLNINKNKNRYINIIPYDHSRVVLSLQDNTPGSDYINASFIDAYQRPNGYIASQGPIPSTFPDFWRMIWELDTPTIVMVTNLKEEDKIKCHQYWPSYGTTTYGNIQVTLKEVENLAEYSIRTFNVSPLAGQSRVPMPVREVRQFHFLVWPDHGVPLYATNLLSFRKRILKYHPEKRGPMVVHCSAGVGRTGTFITIDYMLKRIDAEGSIDIFNFVRHMRYRRNYMVQTSPQYVFIHDALLESIMCGDNSIKAPEMKTKVKELKAVLAETGKTVLETQFATLITASPPDDDFDCSIAQLPDNMSKNRCKTHLPANDYRVVLSTDGDQSDYICASYVDNYRERNAFIVTQAPLTDTVYDFWRMMWETKSAAIVMLTELTEGDQEMCVKYWPSGVGDPGVYGGYQVELSEEEKDRGGYITRRFKVSPVDKPQDSRMVSQFHFTKWTKTTPPTDCRQVIDLIDELQRVQRKSGNMPITVHCDDGVSRTGAFCALYSVLERVKTEQIVDVFQAVKTLRIQRAGLLGTIEEYEFVHHAVIEFLDTFSDYQNFK